MALPRPLLFALIGAVLLGAAFFATQVMAGGRAGEAPKPAPTAAESTAPPAASPGPGKPAAPRKEPGALSGKAIPAARALEHGKVVVLLFVQRDAADDDATGHAVRSLRKSGGRRATVIVDRVENVVDYGPIAANLGVTQAPSVVIADGKRKARVLEGYQDEGTIRQTVRDATR